MALCLSWSYDKATYKINEKATKAERQRIAKNRKDWLYEEPLEIAKKISRKETRYVRFDSAVWCYMRLGYWRAIRRHHC